MNVTLLKAQQGIRARPRQYSSSELGASSVTDSLAAQLCALNLDFLQLIAGSCAGRFDFHMDEERSEGVRANLYRLTDRERVELARCPSALFDLCFEDDELWAGILDRRAAASGEHLKAAPVELIRFITCGLFFAWHAAHVDSMFARFALGLRQPTVDKLKRSAVSGLAESAQFCIGSFKPRWAQASDFWPGLVQSVAANRPEQLEFARLLACQLSAETNSRRLRRGVFGPGSRK